MERYESRGEMEKKVFFSSEGFASTAMDSLLLRVQERFPGLKSRNQTRQLSRIDHFRILTAGLDLA